MQLHNYANMHMCFSEQFNVFNLSPSPLYLKALHWCHFITLKTRYVKIKLLDLNADLHERI